MMTGDFYFNTHSLAREIEELVVVELEKLVFPFVVRCSACDFYTRNIYHILQIDYIWKKDEIQVCFKRL